MTKLFSFVRVPLLCLLIFASAIMYTEASVIHVSTGGSDSNNGSSWPLSKSTVQAAINSAVSGDEIWVAAGTYVQRITLKDGVKLYGGFAGVETLLDQRNSAVNVTILDGGQGGSVVTVSAGTTPATLIDGFTIQHGTGTLINGNYMGGGICCREGSLTISNNIITDNNVANNNSNGYGGGIYCRDVLQYIIDNVISNNSVSMFGGGIYCHKCPVEIRGNRIENNTSPSYGGGILCGGDGCTQIIEDNLIKDNSGASVVGGIYAIYGSPIIRNNILEGNTSSEWIGGIYCYGSYSVVVNNLLINNIGAKCGGICAGYDYSTISNNTIIGSNGSYGALYCCNGMLNVRNNIVAYSNAQGFYVVGQHNVNNNCFYSNASDYAGMYLGNGAITQNPLFMNRANNDYHLQIGSPCIDAGLDDTAQSDWLDMDDQERVNGVHIDIGADEFYQVDMPIISPDAGSYKTAQTVTLSCSTDGAQIRYTTDGSTPVSTSALYTAPIQISSSATVKAIGCKANYVDSEVSSTDFIIDTQTPVSGTASSPDYAGLATVVQYSGASDAGDSELKKVELWYKKGSSGSWINSGLSSTTSSGSFSFTFPSGEGTYYFDLVAEDKAGNRSSEAAGSGDDSTVCDLTPPASVNVTDDGATTTSTTELHAEWTASSDPQSGITEYQYAIGTSPGATNVVDWTSQGVSTSVTRTGLALLPGITYYFAVRAKNGAGEYGQPACSDGIYIDAPFSFAWDASLVDSTGTVKLSWAYMPGAGGFDHCNVLYSADGVNWYVHNLVPIIQPSCSDYRVWCMPVGGTYSFKVVAYQSADDVTGYSSTVNTVSITSPYTQLPTWYTEYLSSGKLGANYVPGY